jgi:hypothetical protein
MRSRIEDRSRPIIIQQDLTIDAQPVRVLKFSERVMRNRTIKYVRILWSNQTEREATWELESTKRNKYPDLFETGKFFVVQVHQPSFGFFVEAAEFEDEFFLGGGECNAKKLILKEAPELTKNLTF